MHVLYCIFCFRCAVLCIVCMSMCTVLLPPGVNTIAVNKFFKSYHLISYHIIVQGLHTRFIDPTTVSFQQTSLQLDPLLYFLPVT